MDILCRIAFRDDFSRFIITSPTGGEIEIVGDCSEIMMTDLKKRYLTAREYCKRSGVCESTQVHLSRAAMTEAFNLAKAQDIAIVWSLEHQ